MMGDIIAIVKWIDDKVYKNHLLWVIYILGLLYFGFTKNSILFITWNDIPYVLILILAMPFPVVGLHNVNLVFDSMKAHKQTISAWTVLNEFIWVVIRWFVLWFGVGGGIISILSAFFGRDSGGDDIKPRYYGITLYASNMSEEQWSYTKRWFLLYWIPMVYILLFTLAGMYSLINNYIALAVVILLYIIFIFPLRKKLRGVLSGMKAGMFLPTIPWRNKWDDGTLVAHKLARGEFILISLYLLVRSFIFSFIFFFVLFGIDNFWLFLDVFLGFSVPVCLLELNLLWNVK